MTLGVRVLRWLLIGLAAVAALAGGLAVVARFSDGPLGPFPGGKLGGVEVLRKNRLAFFEPVDFLELGDVEQHAAADEAVTDWSPLLEGANHVEIEVDPAAPRSLTTSFLVRDGVLYVPSMFAAHKRWPKLVLADGRVVLRVHGKLYERRAVRVTDPVEIRALVRAWHPETPEDIDVGTLSTWYFRMEPRTP